MISMRNILVPTDFSSGSEVAFDTAVGLARDARARLTLFYVNRVPATVFPDMIMPLGPELLHDAEHAADEQLEELCRRAEAAGVDADWRTAFGTPAIEICALADELEIDLIVIGAHGRAGLSHALLGSVAEKVVRKAPCPVLTVRADMRSSIAHA
jgi:nucleotide-binding universal stress UspA family protein